MVSNGAELLMLLDKIFLPKGYIRKKDTWYLVTKDCICFFNIEKSRYASGHYGHVMGCFLKEIHGEIDLFPKPHENHLQYDLGEFMDRRLVKKMFSLNNSDYENDEREVIITEIVAKYALPFLQDISTKKGLVDAVGKYKGLEHWMNVKMKKALSIPFED